MGIASLMQVGRGGVQEEARQEFLSPNRNSNDAEALGQGFQTDNLVEIQSGVLVRGLE